MNLMTNKDRYCATHIFHGFIQVAGKETKCRFVTSNLNSFLNLSPITEILLDTGDCGMIRVRKMDVDWDFVEISNDY